MKIPNLNNISNNKQIDIKQKTATGDGFRNLMEQYKITETDKTAQPQQTLECGSMMRSSVLSGSHIQQASINGLRGLVKDSLSFSANEIMREIDLVCADETGEQIDMEQLNALLKLHKEIQ